MQYRLDPQFAQLLPSLAPSERAQLKASLAAEKRCLDPLIVWEETPGEPPLLIDGHHRNELLAELRAEGVEIPAPALVVKHFASRGEVVRWMIAFQGSRRNLTPAERARIVLENQALINGIQAEAKANQRKSRGRGQKGRAHAPSLKTDRELAAFAGCGETTLKTVRKILDAQDAELIAEMFAPQPNKKGIVPEKISAREAARKLDNKIQHTRLIELNRTGTILPPLPLDAKGKLDVIHQGDTLELLKAGLVAPASVDLIITSPPYFLPEVKYASTNNDYTGYDERLHFLAQVFKEAFKTQKSGGRIVINIDASNNRAALKSNRQPGQPSPDKVHPVYEDISRVLREAGYRFFGEWNWFKQNTVGHRPNYGTHCSPREPNIRRNHEYLLAFFKDTPEHSWDATRGPEPVIDIAPKEFEQFGVSSWYIKPQARKKLTDPHFHPAPFPVEIPYRLVTFLSYVGDTVMDLFNGSGTTCFVAKGLQRRYIGLDFEASYCQAARERLATLDGLTPAQMRKLIDSVRFKVKPGERTDGREPVAPPLRLAKDQAA